MLNHRVPWQYVVTVVFIGTVFFIIALLGSLISGYLNWNSIITVIFLILGFIIIIWTIPTFLNLSRYFYKFLFTLLLLQSGTTILAFALHYKSSGLIGECGEFIPDLSDAIYFSITTFTTLGYGDLQPLESHRLTTSYEALAGMASMAIGASLIWLWCQENLIPKEMALFDGDRINKKLSY
ncbi:ion channel [Nitrosomonas ureae]|uniref:potassium channel family protein n=1 Tax=Nitrosomonas ureae TaxID=44577 RepID=UPI000D76F0DB|nr:potassium channel family protein [Nitrosomonas ureae]PXX07119.1 ion channel [Nitrosomonas ureae]